ncbi:hypothetical protein DO70_3806 [Burkholderia pseudomallei]|nr:hypothetical protein DO70_3806 [Burkholderia pseudomallei]
MLESASARASDADDSNSVASHQKYRSPAEQESALVYVLTIFEIFPPSVPEVSSGKRLAWGYGARCARAADRAVRHRRGEPIRHACPTTGPGTH